jgi:phosphatidylglycerol:prolipoprotein diacylglycerol transferase
MGAQAAFDLHAQSHLMLMYPHIDPIALQIGPLAIHWYGLTYLAAFGLFMFLGIRRLKH